MPQVLRWALIEPDGLVAGTTPEDRFQHVNNPVSVNGQRGSSLRFADPRVHPL
jgi:hypothetical protein